MICVLYNIKIYKQYNYLKYYMFENIYRLDRQLLLELTDELLKQ